MKKIDLSSEEVEERGSAYPLGQKVMLIRSHHIPNDWGEGVVIGYSRPSFPTQIEICYYKISVVGTEGYYSRYHSALRPIDSFGCVRCPTCSYLLTKDYLSIHIGNHLRDKE